MKTEFSTKESWSLEMDEADELKSFKERFYLLEDAIYMDGNSLGLMSVDAEESLLRVVNEWKTLGINGWMGGDTPWFYYPEMLAGRLADLIGAEKDEVMVHSSTTVNLHLLLATFYRPEGKRTKILMDNLTFPSDRYAVESFMKTKGYSPGDHLVIFESADGKTLDEKALAHAISEEVALVLLPSVLYRSGQLLDMEYLTNKAHEKGVLIGFDCAHSIGAVPHKFKEYGLDFAFWCNYKYVNNGPGGTGGFYINRRHFGREGGLAGWDGVEKEKQFDLENEFHQNHCAGGWQIGTSHMLSMAPLEGSLKLYEEAGALRLREKSLKLTSYMMFLIDELLAPYGFAVGTPAEEERRGGHVALEHEEAVRINEALKERGVVPDFRPPNIIRLAPVPLYTSYHDVWKVISAVKEIYEKGEYRNYDKKRGTVA